MYTKEETKRLEPFFTNLNKNVFVLLNMPEILKGALFSRYSRSAKSLRTLFLEDYVKSEEFSKEVKKINLDSLMQLQKMLATEKAENFYAKWLAEYGDDSIAELGGVHVALENISVLATKTMEDRRIGASYLEKSTRYVRFDDKVRGKYKYYRDKELMKSKYANLYVKTMDYLFDTYSDLVEPMKNYFKTKFPKPETVSDKAFETSIRAKACDTLRGLLPLSTLTNMGIFANGRTYEYMLTKMYSNELTETKLLAKSMYEELDKVIHNFIERIKSEKGANYIKYLESTTLLIENKTKKFRTKAKIKSEKVTVQIIDYDKDAENKIIASIIFPHSNISLKTIFKEIKKLGKQKRAEILKSYYEKRLGRWHKIGRAFEDSFYHFEIISDFGAYKDLQRHRQLTQEKQTFSCDLGYDVPGDVTLAGYEKKYSKAMLLAQSTFSKLTKVFPLQAQYAVTHGYKVRYRMKMNLREAFHLCELRSSPQGHPNYRFIAQEIYKRICEVHPNLGEAMKFVNMSNPGLERLSAEIRKEDKMKKFV